METLTTSSFSSLPTDLQINILSFLLPIDISSFASTCRHFYFICNPSSSSSYLWPSLCHRRWGYKTNLHRWSIPPSFRLYQTLDRYERLIGLYRHIDINEKSLVFFEWTSSCITASRISPSPAISGGVCKIPFIWLGVSVAGDALSYLIHPDVVPVTVSLMGCNHLVVEERRISCVDPIVDDRAMSEMYQYFANRAGPGRQRRKKVKERIGRRREADHFVKIPNYFPTLDRPLQGLWKVIVMRFDTLLLVIVLEFWEIYTHTTI